MSTNQNNPQASDAALAQQIYASVDSALADALVARALLEQPATDPMAWIDTVIGHLRSALQQVQALRAEARPPAGAGWPFDFATHLQRQREFSERTFGPGTRTAGVVDHIRKELREIEAAPHDASEWADVVILGLDGFWRAGFTPQQIIAALVAKQTKNEARTWPDWRTQPKDKAIEHDRLLPSPPSSVPPAER